jgi:hypothetical protein
MPPGARGFAAGTIGLIVLYVLTQRGASDRVSSAGGIIANTIRRLGSPDIAGIPQVKTDNRPPPADGGPVQGFIRPLPATGTGSLQPNPAFGSLHPNPALNAGRATGPVRFF